MCNNLHQSWRTRTCLAALGVLAILVSLANHPVLVPLG
jgi:hypothetical protein